MRPTYLGLDVGIQRRRVRGRRDPHRLHDLHPPQLSHRIEKVPQPPWFAATRRAHSSHIRVVMLTLAWVRRTDGLINRLIMYTISTGALLALNCDMYHMY